MKKVQNNDFFFFETFYRFWINLFDTRSLSYSERNVKNIKTILVGHKKFKSFEHLGFLKKEN